MVKLNLVRIRYNLSLVKILNLFFQSLLNLAQDLLYLLNVRNWVQVLKHAEESVFVTRLILDQEWIFWASLRMVLQNLILQDLGNCCNSFLGLYFVLNGKLWVRIFVGSGSLLKKELLLLSMFLRSYWRAAALKVDQLAIFVSELQIVVVRDVCGRFLRLAYLCNLQVKGLCWSVEVLFDEIIVFLWGYICVIFAKC